VQHEERYKIIQRSPLSKSQGEGAVWLGKAGLFEDFPNKKANMS